MVGLMEFIFIYVCFWFLLREYLVLKPVDISRCRFAIFYSLVRWCFTDFDLFFTLLEFSPDGLSQIYSKIYITDTHYQQLIFYIGFFSLCIEKILKHHKVLIRAVC